MKRFHQYLRNKYQLLAPQQGGKKQSAGLRELELSSLFEIARILNASLELKHVLNNVLLIPMGRMLISRGMIFLKNNQTFQLSLFKGIPELQRTSRESGSIQFPTEEPLTDLRNIFELSKKEKELGTTALYRFAREHRMVIGIPFVLENQLLGVAFLGKKLNDLPFDEEEKSFLSALGNIASPAIHNSLQLETIRQINRQLDEKIQQLHTLFDIARGLSATLDEEHILKLLGLSLMGQLRISRYALIMPEQKHHRVSASRGFNENQLAALSTALAGDDLQIQQMTPAAHLPGNLQELFQLHHIQYCIPLLHQHKILGYLLLGEKTRQLEFSESEQEFITTLVNQAVISLENARLFKETLEKQRMEEELKVARSIQQKLLPRQLPEIPDYQVAGTNIPSKEVGGDYFDVIPLPEDRVAFAIADVSGKSVPAALLMANLQAALRLIISDPTSLAEKVRRINRLIYLNTDLDRFVTFFIGILDYQHHQLTYVNAGHNPPLLMKGSGELKQLEIGGLILGVLPDHDYQMETVSLEPGNMLVCYTDGITEALNRQGEEFGEERLQGLIQKANSLSPAELVKRIVEDVQEFSKGVPQTDDLTLLVLKRMDDS